MIVNQHLPKTGGTTIAFLVRRALPDDHFVEYKQDCDVERALLQKSISTHFVSGHLSTRLIRRHFKEAHVITCLREPVERVISQFFYWRAFFDRDVSLGASSRYALVIDAQTDPWTELLRLLDNYDVINYMELRNLQSAQLADHPFDRLLSETETYNNALQTLESAAVVGTTDHILDFCTDTFSLLGVSSREDVLGAKENVNPTKPSSDQIPDHVRLAIERHNRIDIAVYAEARRLSDRSHLKKTYLPLPKPDYEVEAKPTTIVYHPSSFWDDEGFKAIPGWMIRPRMVLFYNLCRLQSEACRKGAILEFRPLDGQQLVALGKMLPEVKNIIGVGFEDDSRVYHSAAGTHARCVANITNHLKGTELYTEKDASKIESISMWDPAMRPRVGLVSRPFHAKEVCEQLAYLENVMLQDGFVFLDSVFNAEWTQVIEGLYEYLVRYPHGLIPSLICNDGIVLFRRENAYCFIDTVKTDYHDIKWAKFFGAPILQLRD